MTFHEDLVKGLAIEKLGLDIYRRECPCATIVNAYKGYDIWLPEENYGIEVKYDPKSIETGNVIVEIEMNGKPSGLMTTTAKYWVFYDDDMFMQISTRNIIKCIFLNKLVYTEFTGKGDKATKKAFLVKKEILYKYGEPI
jgi:hypothetical protein